MTTTTAELRHELTVTERLTRARALIEDPKRWIKGSYIRTNNEGVDCFCAEGAYDEVKGGEQTYMDGWCALLAALPVNQQGVKRFGNIPQFNDDLQTTHADVLALFDRAIEASKVPA